MNQKGSIGDVAWIILVIISLAMLISSIRVDYKKEMLNQRYEESIEHFDKVIHNYEVLEEELREKVLKPQERE